MKFDKAKVKIAQSVAALKHRNFRLFWIGQCISLIGTWMQNVAQAWLVTEITHPNEAIWLGRVTAIQFLPIMLFSLFAGTLIDRFSKKKMLIFAQTMMMVLAFILALDIYLKTVVLWHVLLIAWFLGCANTLDMPTRQAFMIELVGKEELTNAIVLNSSIFNVARMAGPAIAGVAIARWGMDACFFLNAISFIPVIIGIFMIRLTVSAIPRSELTDKKSMLGEMGEGLAYVWKTPGLLIPMALLAGINIFAFNFQVLIPLYARQIFHGNAQTLGYLMSAFGIGAVAGTVVLALRSGAGRNPKFKLLAVAAVMVCIFELITTPVRSFVFVIGLLVLIGFALIAFTITANSLIQMQAPDHLRGRIMSIYSFVLMGISPIGSYWSGAVAQRWGAPATLGIGAFTALLLVLGLLGVRMSLLRREKNEGLTSRDDLLKKHRGVLIAMSHLPFIEGIKERDPKFYETVSGLEELCFSKSSLDQKTKMMIALAVDACVGSSSGVKSVANALRGMGVTDEQIGEILRITYFAKGNEVLSVSMNAFDKPQNVWA